MSEFPIWASGSGESVLQALNYTVTSTYQGLGRGRSYLGELSRSKFLPFIPFYVWELPRSSGPLAWSGKEQFYLRLQYWLFLWFSPLIFINNLVYQPPFLYFLCSSLYLRGLSPGNYISHLSLLPPFWICFRLCQWNAWIRNLEVTTSLTGMVVDTETPRHKVMFSSVVT